MTSKCQACEVNTRGLDEFTLKNDSTIILCRSCKQTHASLIVDPPCVYCAGEFHREVIDEHGVLSPMCEQCGDDMERVHARAKRSDIEECRGDYLREMARDERQARR